MLKNYASTSSMPNIFGDIEKTLISHGAKQIIRDYGDDGRIISISFVIEAPSGTLGIRLPAKFNAVQKIFDNQGVRYKPEQPYRTAWATLRDWVSAQMALVEWEMVKPEEVFLPYIIMPNGQTFFEIAQQKGFLLEEPKEEKSIEGTVL